MMICLIGLCTSTMAQKWVANEHKADPLKKQKAYTSYRFEDANENLFIYWTWSLKDGDFRIVTSSHIFNYENDKKIFKATIGFFDTQDNMIDESKVNMKVEKDAQYASVLNTLTNKTAKKMIKYLNEQEGYVRIIAPLYGTNQDFDIKVYCHKSSDGNQ